MTVRKRLTRSDSTYDIYEFRREYEKKFILKTSILNRLLHDDYGLITKLGKFRSPYVYYYFLGKYLARNVTAQRKIIDRLMDRSHVWKNAVSLMFLIHHTTDDDIVEDIVVRSMVALDGVEPAILDDREVKIFDQVVKDISENILSGESPQDGRRKDRLMRDQQDSIEGETDLTDGRPSNTDEEMGIENEVYRILKNNEILAQILRNRYGKMERSRIREIVEAIIDGGLKNVRLILGEQDEINDTASFLHESHPEFDIDQIRAEIRRLMFLWTIINIESVVDSLNTPAISRIVGEVVREKNTPAHDVIGYFSRLDTIENFEKDEKSELANLLKKHRSPLLQRVLSLRTQMYLNTHHVRVPIEQSVCSLLGIRYQSRIKKIA